MKLTASQAAKETGKSIPTITRAIKSGKISAEKTEKGGYLIDPSELFRVFKRVTDEANVTPTKLDRETPNETATLELEKRIRLLEETLSEVRADRDEWRDQAKRLALALPPPSEVSPVAQSEKKWWKFWGA